ncbi:ArsR family transcriptional regulator [Microbispora triticiradicis]|uniref:ArsR family transcriptional regulator n=1 Tax=Microbispora triticiradicis TaxID=2200763 RepID=A0ABX9LIR7_9ACTN|nr:helix-turn-helix domain-containing protein [Microbispora triticiradicis]RGA03526.1 ArsR family transcriptional regulator [Microbispora triticiradicis]GLW25147.1 transcriptional regulator [Microbispora amethystogenes]
MATAELLLHPVRLRIVQALLGDRTLTTGELRAELPDVPTATLYRQVAALVEGEIIEIVAERKVRGTFERSYRLRAANAIVTAEDAAGLGADDHRQAFMTFVASLLADFDRYLYHGDFDLGRDGVGYRQTAMYLSDEEFREFLGDLAAVLRPRLANRPAPGRVRRLLSTVVMPARPPA